MEWFSKAFLKASLVWLTLGVLLGLTMAVRPTLVIYRPVHAHLNLVGFVSMMIFGVAYHVIPRFTGHPLHSRPLATAHWWLANAGLLLLVCGLAAQVRAERVAPVLLAVGGTLSAAGMLAFVYNLWRTIDGRRLEAALVTQAPPAQQPLTSIQSARIASRRI